MGSSDRGQAGGAVAMHHLVRRDLQGRQGEQDQRDLEVRLPARVGVFGVRGSFHGHGLSG